MSQLNLILLGAPGAGKGTQASNIEADYKIPHISTGELLRLEIKEKTIVGLEAKKYMDAGDLVPDRIVIGVAKNRIMEMDTDRGFLFDGFPRTIPQAEILDKTLETLGRSLSKVIAILVDEEELFARLCGRRVCRDCHKSFNLQLNPPKNKGVCDFCKGELFQRSDDSKKTVRNRLNVYGEYSRSLIDYYDQTGIVARIDGAQAPGEVYADICEALDSNAGDA